jgi:glyoxylase-like metal-dependent hydrolase (beta-lactamase superfamily II)
MPEARHGEFAGHHPAAQPAIALEHHHLLARGRQVGRGHQAVMARADTDDIRVVANSSPLDSNIDSGGQCDYAKARKWPVKPIFSQVAAIVSTHHEIYAVRYAHLERTATHNFLGGDSHDVPMPLDYFVWAIVSPERTLVVDTGFDAAQGANRKRILVRPVEDGLRAIGIEHSRVSDVIITHMHYDHSGNHHLFPNARMHLQDAEMRYCTGRSMTHAHLRAPFEAEDVACMVRRVFDDRVVFHDGDAELAPGVSLHRLGGHTPGLQVVRVSTDRGPVVLASDAAHFYANFDQGRPYPIIDNVSDYLEAHRKIRKLAASAAHIIPGHDPLVLTRYPRATEHLADIVRLDLDPSPD